MYIICMQNCKYRPSSLREKYTTNLKNIVSKKTRLKFAMRLQDG